MQGRKPKLGQNFLVDDVARYRIADALGEVSSRTVIEIGPGHGAITNILAERAGKLICIELDRALAAELRFRFRNHSNVQIEEADVLKVSFGSMLSGGERALVVGNLPYYITSDILLHLFANSASLETAVVMMQREVAERVGAAPGTRDFGLLSATAQMYAHVNQLFTLPPESFQPPPLVYSSVLRLQFQSRFEEFGIADPAAFDRFLKACFRQKRKTLGNNLRAADYTAQQVMAACGATNTDAGDRAESLPLDRLALLFRALTGTLITPSM